jgi:uncharacterized protein YutE (UPF0331/DUF86 family)
VTRGKADHDLIRRHLIALDDALANLRRHRATPLETLRSDRDILWAVERGLQVCAQNVLDIATHIVASAGRDAPDYTTALDELARLGILPGEYVARFRGIAGFRNVLVHAYLDVDVRRVHEVLNNQLDDFADFAGHIERHLKQPDA